MRLRPFHALLALLSLAAAWACEPVRYDEYHFAPLPTQENTDAQRRLEFLTDRIEDDGSEPDYHYQRARLNHELGRYRSALRDIEAAIRLGGNQGKYLFWKANTLTALKDYPQALAAAAQALALGEKHADMEVLLGQLYFHNGNSADALQRLEPVYQEFPQNATAAFYLGAIFEERQDTATALRHYRQAIVLQPAYTEAYLRLLQRANDPASKGELLRKALAACPPNAEIFQETGDWLWAQQLSDSATYWYRRSLQLQPGAWKAHYQMAQYHLAQRNYVLAESYYKEALSYNPNIPGGYYQIGYIYEFYLGQLDAAKQAYQKGLRVDPAYAQELELSLKRVERKRLTPATPPAGMGQAPAS